MANGSNPIRVLFINRMASIERGGGETFDLEMGRQLAMLGCEVSFLTGVPLFGRRRLGPKEWWSEAPDTSNATNEVQEVVRSERISEVIKDYSIRSPYFGWLPWDKFSGGWRIRVADFRCFQQKAARWVAARAGQFDIVQVCELPGFVDYFKQRNGALPVSMRLTAPDFYDPYGALKRADAVIASGTTIQKMREGARLDCVNVPNGVDIALFRPHVTNFRKEHGWSESDFVVLSVARFQSVKNHAMLIEAFRVFHAEEPCARLVLAGSGPLESSIRSSCAALGIAHRVSFLGEVPYDRVSDLYASADLAVISSDYESFSFVALEAMATQLPLLVTATGWVPTLIGGSANTPGEVTGGLVVPCRDTSAFALALKRLSSDPDVRVGMGLWNRERVVRDFGWAASAEKLLGLYRKLASKLPRSV